MSTVQPGSTRRIDAIGAGVCLGLLTLAYFAAVVPAISSKSRAASQQNERAGILRRDSANQGELRLAQAAQHQNESAIASLPVKLRPASVVNSQLAMLVELARAAGLNVGDMTPEAPVVAKRFVSTPIKLRGTGTYLAAMRFLNDVHDRCADTGVTGLVMISDASTPESVPSFRFDLEWYAAPADRDALGSVDLSK